MAEERTDPRPFVAAVVVTSAGVLPVFLTGALAAEIQRDLAFGDAALGLSFALMFGATAVASIPAGRLTDRIGWQRAVDLTTGLALLTHLGIALAGRSYALLVGLLMVGGVVQALAFPTANLAVVRELSPKRRGLLFGIKQSAVPGGGVMAGLALPLIALPFGWRWAFAAGAVVPAVAFAVARSLGVRTPRFPQEPAGAVTRASTRGPLLVLAAGVGLTAVTLSSLSAFFVVSSIAHGVQPGAAGVLLAFASVVTIAMMVANGWRVDRGGGDGLMGVAFLILTAAAGYGLLASASPALIAAGALLAYGTGWSWTGLMHFGVVAHHPHAPAAATGVALTGMFAGSFGGPLVYGALAERFGYATAWGVMAVVALAGSGLIALAAVRFRATVPR